MAWMGLLPQIQSTMQGVPRQGSPESGAETKRCLLSRQPDQNEACPDHTSDGKPGRKGLWNKVTSVDMACKLLSLVEQGDDDSSFSSPQLLILFLETEFFHM